MLQCYENHASFINTAQCFFFLLFYFYKDKVLLVATDKTAPVIYHSDKFGSWSPYESYILIRSNKTKVKIQYELNKNNI